MRAYSARDGFCLKVDKIVRFLSGNLALSEHHREVPGSKIHDNAEFTQKEIQKITSYMRVNYAGEVCAQGLYQGQALMTKNQTLKTTLEKAGLEEQDHLYWCQSRLQALGAKVSYLNPFFYAGSFALGLTAGLIGDEWNLGFLQETENQVVRHLDAHLDNLPEQDVKTRVILETMKQEELHHATTAQECGAKSLPLPIKKLMQLTSKIMTKTTYWI